MSEQTNNRGDLISRSALLEMLRYNKEVHTDENGESRQLIAVDINRMIEYVEQMPTAFDVDKAVADLGALMGKNSAFEQGFHSALEEIQTYGRPVAHHTVK